MIELLIDLYKTKELYSGLGQFSINFARELMLQSPENFEIVYLVPENFDNTIYNLNAENVNFQKRYLPRFNRKYDIWHGLQQFPSHFPNKNSKFILTVHDLNFLYEKNEFSVVKYLHRLQKNIDRADYITTISDFTKKSIETHIDLKGKQVRTIYNGIPENSFSKPVKPGFVSEKKYFFSIGIFNEKKNFHSLLSLLIHFPDYELIIAGNNASRYGHQIRKQINELNLNDRIILPGTIADEEKQWLYANCEAFLFPSLAEGFGMPVIEAMRHGKPVFLSKFTSLPEIGGNAAFYFENFEPGSMAELIRSKTAQYKSNRGQYKKQIMAHAEKFSWQSCVNQYIELYREMDAKICK